MGTITLILLAVCTGGLLVWGFMVACIIGHFDRQIKELKTSVEILKGIVAAKIKLIETLQEQQQQFYN